MKREMWVIEYEFQEHHSHRTLRDVTVVDPVVLAEDDEEHVERLVREIARRWFGNDTPAAITGIRKEWRWKHS